MYIWIRITWLWINRHVWNTEWIYEIWNEPDAVNIGYEYSSDMSEGAIYSYHIGML